ncbi:hypothetical protein AB1Y20_001889 [Prymnesium parvum]|uniref:NADPH-dependent 7-cyano-7-deazaguanine reductase N-terminal domain-containing protein n=1 Tax=Prymnesium parvum TaxID=97485 RepID=A0AB34J910_PRYPA
MDTPPPSADYGPLGRTVAPPESYDPSVLAPIPRERGRSLLRLDPSAPLPFHGTDVWTLYEASWLLGAKPRRLILEMRVSASTPCLVESKSLKLYLNSLNFTPFASDAAAIDTIRADVGRVVGGEVELRARELLAEEEPPALREGCGGGWECIDGAQLEEAKGEALLRAEGEEVEEALVSHLLRTLCPCTGQPDWGSVLVEYAGPRIDRSGLLAYVCAMRREVGFHENAVEQIFLAIREGCRPRKLRVTGRFFRRGGIDINPTRAVGYAEDEAPACRIPGQ